LRDFEGIFMNFADKRLLFREEDLFVGKIGLLLFIKLGIFLKLRKVELKLDTFLTKLLGRYFFQGNQTLNGDLFF
jgi:hypothetical protein